MLDAWCLMLDDAWSSSYKSGGKSKVVIYKVTSHHLTSPIPLPTLFCSSLPILCFIFLFIFLFLFFLFSSRQSWFTYTTTTLSSNTNLLFLHNGAQSSYHICRFLSTPPYPSVPLHTYIPPLPLPSPSPSPFITGWNISTSSRCIYDMIWYDMMNRNTRWLWTIQYSMYGHIVQLAEAEKAGLKKAGIDADIFQWVSQPTATHSSPWTPQINKLSGFPRLFPKKFSLRYVPLYPKPSSIFCLIKTNLQ